MIFRILNVLFRLIQTWLDRLFVLTQRKKIEDMNVLQINVHYGQNRSTVPLVLKPDWSVKEVKEALGPKIKLAPSEIKIIFAGKELSDSVRLEDCIPLSGSGSSSIYVWDRRSDSARYSADYSTVLQYQLQSCNKLSLIFEDSQQDCDIGQQSILHVVKANKLDGLKVTASIDVSSPLDTINKLQLTEEEHKQYDSIKNNQHSKVHFYVFCNKVECKNVMPGKLRVRCSKCKLGTLTVNRDPCGWDDVLTPGRIKGVCQSEDCSGDTAEFYFKCASNHIDLNTEDGMCVALYLIKTNIFEVPCLACTDVSSPVLVFSCADSHVICLDCFKTYCTSKLNERQFIEDVEFGYTLPCAAGCENSFIKETHHFKILGEEQYDRYQRFATEEFVLQSGGVLCPQPGCGAGIIPDPECNKVICSPNSGCGYVFCKRCLQGYHIGDCLEPSCDSSTDAEYRVNREHAHRSRWEDPTNVTIRVLTKPCPKCRTPTERDGGCMHMICTRPQCGFDWCWVCQTEWTRDCMASHWF